MNQERLRERIGPRSSASDVARPTQARGPWQQPRRAVRVSRRLVAIGAVLCMLPAMGCLGSKHEQIVQPSEMLAFDWGSSPLTELEFFNELTSWFEQSNRFSGATAFRERQATFELMARRGYGPAAAAVAVFDFSTRRPTGTRPGVFEELLRSARRGDISSQCALYPVYFLSTGSFKPPGGAAASLIPLLRSGSEKGHYACQFYLGVFLEEGREGLSADRGGADQLLASAAAQGFVRAQAYMAKRIGTDRVDDLRKAEEALCWSAATYRHSAYEGLHGYVNGLRFRAIEIERNTGDRSLLLRVEGLIDRWLVSRNPTKPRDTDPRECLRIRK